MSTGPTNPRRLALACLALLAACATAPLADTGRAGAPSASATASKSRGTLFIVGGGPQPPALVEEFVRLAGGPGKARIVVLAMASSDGATSGEEKARDLRALGATAINVFALRDQANTDSVARLLDGATGIWFGGGDQVLLARAVAGTATERAIHARYAAGAVIGGTSAGAAVMSTPMITGDEKRPGGARAPGDSSDHWLTVDRADVVTTDGFGLVTHFVVDQHFVRRKRHNRLISLVLEREPHLGVGIDESTALIVEPDGRWRVAGASVAMVFDARGAAVTPVGTTLGASGMRLHILPAGSRFDPRTGVASLPRTP